MQIGELRTRITLQSRSNTTNAGGFQSPSWATIADVWAKWDNAHGSEVWAAQSVQAEAPATVTVRYRTGLDTTCAVFKGSDRYEIISIDDIHDRHVWLELKVRKMRSG
jgi:SPP1 family predicted phage head-tail adaptor